MARHRKTAADLGAWLRFEDEAGQGLRPPKGRTWGRRGHTPVVRVTAAGIKRVCMAALVCTEAGHRPRLICRIHLDRGPVIDRRTGFIETDYAFVNSPSSQVLICDKSSIPSTMRPRRCRCRPCHRGHRPRRRRPRSRPARRRSRLPPRSRRHGPRRRGRPSGRRCRGWPSGARCGRHILDVVGNGVAAIGSLPPTSQIDGSARHPRLVQGDVLKVRNRAVLDCGSKSILASCPRHQEQNRPTFVTPAVKDLWCRDRPCCDRTSSTGQVGPRLGSACRPQGCLADCGFGHINGVELRGRLSGRYWCRADPGHLSR